MTTKFLHYRALEDDGSISSNGGFTVAYIEGEAGITYATARCNPSDNYNKAYGRAKAEGRMRSERFMRTYEGGRANFLDFQDLCAVSEGFSR